MQIVQRNFFFKPGNSPVREQKEFKKKRHDKVTLHVHWELCKNMEWNTQTARMNMCHLE